MGEHALAHVSRTIQQKDELIAGSLKKFSLPTLYFTTELASNSSSQLSHHQLLKLSATIHCNPIRCLSLRKYRDCKQVFEETFAEILKTNSAVLSKSLFFASVSQIASMIYNNALGLTFMLCDDGSFVALDGSNSKMLGDACRHPTSALVVRDLLNLPDQHSSELGRTQIPTTNDSQGKSSLVLHTSIK